MRLVGLVIAGCVVGAGVASAQPAHLSPDQVPGAALEAEPPEIDVLTFGVGEPIFEKFGHAALCLRYHERAHPAVCFNYGVTNFAETDAMVWNFLRGKQKFWVEPTSLASMMSFYEWEDRDIWVQTLPPGTDTRALEAALWANLDDDKRFYNYDHFFDNCTTRLRDLIDRATHGALRRGTDVRYPVTFRNIGRPGLAETPALLALSDLMTGRRIDAYPTVWEAMFHPAIFRQQLEVQLGAVPRQLYKRQGPAFPTEVASTGRLGLLAIGLAFAIPLLVAQWRRRFERTALAWLTLELVVLGTLVWGLAIVSPIAAVRYNEAVFVVTPLDLALPFLGAASRRRYAFARLGLLVVVSLLAAIGVFHQPLWMLIVIVFVPMVILALDLPHGLGAQLAAPVVAIPGVVLANPGVVLEVAAPVAAPPGAPVTAAPPIAADEISAELN